MRISDWSSDVCSADLPGVRPRLSPSGSRLGVDEQLDLDVPVGRIGRVDADLAERTGQLEEVLPAADRLPAARRPHGAEIGRASSRERVWQSVSLSVVAVSLKTKI